MPLLIERRIGTQWVQSILMSAGASGSMSHNSPRNGRKVYVYACATGDDWSEIRELEAPLDYHESPVQRIIVTDQAPNTWPLVKKLEPGVPYEMWVRRDTDDTPHRWRFTHAVTPPA